MNYGTDQNFHGMALAFRHVAGNLGPRIINLQPELEF
jgi:hypothetical protein